MKELRALAADATVAREAGGYAVRGTLRATVVQADVSSGDDIVRTARAETAST